MQSHSQKHEALVYCGLHLARYSAILSLAAGVTATTHSET